jgi:tetratricopeptide (TPR) repeat protein
MHPEDADALSDYADLGDPKRVEDFLRAGLARRPVQIQWHRYYQNLHNSAAWHSRLAAEYDSMLKAEPNNSALLYLRGRIMPGAAEAESYYHKAIEADPKNPYPNYALGHHHTTRGDWAGARPFFARAVELQPANQEFISALATCRLALQEYVDLEKEFRDRLKRDSRNLSVAEQLVDVLAAQNRNAEASALVSPFSRAVSGLGTTTAGAYTTELRRHMLYSTGDLAGLTADAHADRSPGGRRAYFCALVEQGKLDEATHIHPIDEAKMVDPYHFLAVGLGWTAAGSPEKASPWFQKGIDLLAGNSAEDALAAALLSGKQEPTRESLDQLTQAAKGKAILLTAMGVLQPGHRTDLFAGARILNVDREYPSQLIRRMTAESH